MRLYYGQARAIAREIVTALVKSELLEVGTESRPEAEGDVEAIVREYIRNDRDLTEQARETLRARGLGNNHFGKIKRRMAKERGFGVGDEAVNWLVDQTIEMLLYSNNVEEVYGEDRELRRAINLVLKSHSETETELDREVRGKLKNLEEGSQAWELEYGKALDILKRNKGLV